MPPTAQALYLWLCSYANESGQCYPSRAKLAYDCGCSDNTVDRMIDLLIEKGLLYKEPRVKDNEKQTNLYTVLIHEGSPTVSLPTSTMGVGVAPQDGIELYPVLTQSNKGGDLYEVRTEVENLPNTWKAKDKVIPTPYSPEKTKEAWSKGERRLQVLSWFMAETGLWSKATNVMKLRQIMNRHSKAAERIANADWELSEVKEARKKIKFNPSLEGEWTLETIEKYLTK